MPHQTIQRQQEALEAKEAPEVVYVWRGWGESAEEAIKRQTVKSMQLHVAGSVRHDVEVLQPVAVHQRVRERLVGTVKRYC